MFWVAGLATPIVCHHCGQSMAAKHWDRPCVCSGSWSRALATAQQREDRQSQRSRPGQCRTVSVVTREEKGPDDLPPGPGTGCEAAHSADGLTPEASACTQASVTGVRLLPVAPQTAGRGPRDRDNSGTRAPAASLESSLSVSLRSGQVGARGAAPGECGVPAVLLLWLLLLLLALPLADLLFPSLSFCPWVTEWL